MTNKAGSESGSVSQRYRSPDPDPYQNVTDPQHCPEVRTESAPEADPVAMKMAKYVHFFTKFLGP
jgi:hypothetical protein